MISIVEEIFFHVTIMQEHTFDIEQTQSHDNQKFNNLI